MGTITHSAHRVKVCACRLGSDDRTILDEPLTEATLPLLTSFSALSRAIVDGAGQEYYPHAIAVLVDGALLWCEPCHNRGATALVSAVRHSADALSHADTNVF